MSGTNEESLRQRLKSEGFRTIYVWQDGPNAFYPEHIHPTETAHVVLDGELSLTMNGSTRILRAEERCDVPSGATHSAQVGAHGCRYLIGER